MPNELQFLLTTGNNRESMNKLTINFLAGSVKNPSPSEAASMGMAPPAGLAISTSYPAFLNS